jgi:hypothetical protein
MAKKRDKEVIEKPSPIDTDAIGLARDCYDAVSTVAISFNDILKLEQDYAAMMVALKELTKKVRERDLSEIESTLAAQTYLLHAIFIKSTDRMANAQYIQHYHAYGAVALKAQNLCRKTAATLADMKNPIRATFIKNTAQNQQVNFGQNFSEKPANELLSEGHDATLDTGGTAAAGRTDTALAAVATRGG